MTVNLGDICSGALFPKETADILMALNLPTIRGNHERQLLTYSYDQTGLSDRYAYDCLEDKHMNWLRALPESLKLTDEILLVHGIPGNDLEYFFGYGYATRT